MLALSSHGISFAHLRNRQVDYVTNSMASGKVSLASQLLREGTVGLLIGGAIGLLAGAAFFFWDGRTRIALVVAVTLAVTAVVATLVASLLPLGLARVGADPPWQAVRLPLSCRIF